MPDSLMLANARTTPFVRTQAGPIELTGRSVAIARVHELVRRAAGVSGGVLITAPSGSLAEAIARDVHERGSHPGAPYVIVECAAREAGGLEQLLFGGAPS